MLRRVLIPRFCALSGYTEKAVRRKMESGMWLEGLVWIKAPDGHIMIDLEGFEKWAMQNSQPDLKAAMGVSEFLSCGAVGGAGKPSNSPQTPQT